MRIALVLASLLGVSASFAAEAGAGASDAAVWMQLGDSLMQRSRTTLDARLWDRAGMAYQRALATEPKNARALLGLAWVRNSQHDFADGRRRAEAALALDPALPDAHALLGDGAVELGDYDGARTHYQSALDLRPDLASYSRAAHLLWLTGRPEAARRVMDMAITAGGPHAENTAWCGAQLAMMWFHAGDLANARRCMDRFSAAAPENPHVLFVAARVSAAEGDLAHATELCRRSISAAPTHEALALLVELLDRTGRIAERDMQFAAVESFHAAHRHEEAGAAAPKHSHASAQLARFRADHDRDLAAALREATEAYRAFPNIFAADALAWCQFKSGDTTAAARTIAEALRWNTPLADLHFHAGMIHAGLGDHVRAREHLATALRLNPSFDARDSAIAAETLRSLDAARPAPGCS